MSRAVWTGLGQLSCVAGNQIGVELGRNSNQRGLVVADVVRIFKIS